MSYSERLLPHWWVWLLAGALVAMLAIAYGAALGAGTGWTVGLAGGVVAGWLLWISSPIIAVDDRDLRAGGARLPRTSIARVDVLDPGALAETMRGDARIFTAVRPWSARGALLVVLDDPADPHPAWVLSTRHPDRLASALAAAGDLPDG